MKPLLTLALMVKDEARTIEGIIDSCAGTVDAVYVLDTGSRDGTQDLARAACARKGLPLRIESAPFSDFSTPLNFCLDAAESMGRWVIRLAGDEFLRDPSGLREALENAPDDVVSFNLQLRIGDDLFDTTRITRCCGGTRYVGRVHEYLKLSPGTRNGGRIRGPWILHSLETRDPVRAMKRFQWDLKVLLEEVRLEPSEPRWVFMLAQTYECLGDASNAIQWYRRRIELGGWKEFLYESWMRIGNLFEGYGLSADRALDAWMHAHKVSPDRAEPLYRLARCLTKEGRVREARLMIARALECRPPTNAALFVQPRVYEVDVPELAKRLGASREGAYRQSP